MAHVPEKIEKLWVINYRWNVFTTFICTTLTHQHTLQLPVAYWVTEAWGEAIYPAHTHTHTHTHTLEVEVFRDLPGEILPAEVSVAGRLLVDRSLQVQVSAAQSTMRIHKHAPQRSYYLHQDSSCSMMSVTLTWRWRRASGRSFSWRSAAAPSRSSERSRRWTGRRTEAERLRSHTPPETKTEERVFSCGSLF